ncbi:ATP-dependent zinc protease family protein [Oceanococcus atlanticus]|nr:RimK/LysX family protein [Oceanococcus atlanticus]
MLPRWMTAGFFTLVLLLTSSASWADDAVETNRTVAGWVERIKLAPWGDTVKAKLDTGAKTSSINALNIERFERDGDDWVRFTLSYETAKDVRKEHTLERPVVRNILIKEHDRENDRRAVVELSFCFAGQIHSTQFSLVDRSKFIYPVLLGRRFLKSATLIDPSATFITEASCKTSDIKDAGQ